MGVGWEGGSRQTGYMYTYGWVTLLHGKHTQHCKAIILQLKNFFNKKKKKEWGREICGVTIQPKAIKKSSSLPATPLASDDGSPVSAGEVVLCSLFLLLFHTGCDLQSFKSCFYFFFLETAHPASGCLPSREERGRNRKKEGRKFLPHTEWALSPSPEHSQILFSRFPTPLPNLPWRFPWLSLLQLCHSHSWPHAQLSHLQRGPASFPDQCGLEAGNN